MDKEYQSGDVGRAALRMALSETRVEESILREELAKLEIRAVAVNFGGKFLDILPKIYESAIVAAQRQHVISDTHVGDGSVLGAVESAIEQIKLKSLGMNVGGKIGVARWHEHLCVAVYVGVGVLRFNEVAVGMAHRVGISFHSLLDIICGITYYIRVTDCKQKSSASHLTWRKLLRFMYEFGSG